MALRTLSDILTAANAFLDLEAQEPTGTELITRSNYANQAIEEAAATAQFSEFKGVYEVDPSTLASISLPSGFREFQTAPRQYSNGQWIDFQEILPDDRYAMNTSDKYCYVLGNRQEGYTAIFNGLEASATLSMIYQRYPTGLPTLTSICELPDPMYVVRKIESYVLQSRGDERFPVIDADAQRLLKNMMGREMKPPGGGVRTMRRKGLANYRIGMR
jgi:hypothetical protein